MCAANDCQHEDAVVKVRVGWANNGSVPVGETLVISFIQTVRDRLVGKLSFFGLLELVVQFEGSRCYTHENKDIFG